MTALLALVAVSRWLAFPASIWDLDEAIFARALLLFDPVHNYPHPPFFPLWIGLGRGLLALRPGLDPALALRLLSATFSVLTVVPLVALWRLVLPRGQAVAAGLLYSFLPLPWILAGRAYTTTTATAFLLVAVTLLLRREPSRAAALAAGAALAACVLVRPQWLPVAATLGILQAVRGRGVLRRSLPLLVPAAAGIPVVAYVAARVGGLPQLLAVVGRHGVYHFGELARYATPLDRVALLGAFGSPWLGLLWLLLGAGGAVVLLIQPSSRRTVTLLLAAVLAPVLAVLLLLENPDSLRYVLPYLALTSGLVVAALGSLVPDRRVLTGLLTVLIVGVAAATLPHLTVYRREPSPAVRAMDSIATVAHGQRIYLIADRRLIAFVELARLESGLDATVTWGGETITGPVLVDGPLAVAVLDPQRDPRRVSGSRSATLGIPDHWLSRFAGGRLTELTVVTGARTAADAGLDREPVGPRPGPVLVFGGGPAYSHPPPSGLFWGRTVARAALDLLSLWAGNLPGEAPMESASSCPDDPAPRSGREVRLGPFDLSAYRAGTLVFARAQNQGPTGALAVSASLDGEGWSGYTCLASTVSPERPIRIELAGWPELGDLAGRSHVWLRFAPTSGRPGRGTQGCVEGVLFERLLPAGHHG